MVLNERTQNDARYTQCFVLSTTTDHDGRLLQIVLAAPIQNVACGFSSKARLQLVFFHHKTCTVYMQLFMQNNIPRFLSWREFECTLKFNGNRLSQLFFCFCNYILFFLTFNSNAFYSYHIKSIE